MPLARANILKPRSCASKIPVKPTLLVNHPMSVSSRQIGLPERNEQNQNAYGDDNDLMESFYEPDPDQDLYGKFYRTRFLIVLHTTLWKQDNLIITLLLLRFVQ
jgi:hypothetical protein